MVTFNLSKQWYLSMIIVVVIETNEVKKNLYLIKQDFFVCFISVKISDLLIGFCSFDFSCPILETENVITNCTLSCLIKEHSLLTLLVLVSTPAVSESRTICTTGRTAISFIYKGRTEMFYLTPHSTHFIYSYMASDIW